MYNPNNTQNFTTHQQKNEINNKNQNLFESKYAQINLIPQTNSKIEPSIYQRNVPHNKFQKKTKDPGFYDSYLGTFVKDQERDPGNNDQHQDQKFRKSHKNDEKKQPNKEKFHTSTKNAQLDYRKILDFETYFRLLEQAGKNSTQDEITEGRTSLQGKRSVEKVNSENKIFNSQGVPNLNANPIDLIRNSRRGQFGNFCSEIDIKVDIEKLDERQSILGKDLFSNKRILEVGCGNGLIGLQIVKFFDVRSYTAMDIDYNMINKCLKHKTLLKNLEKKSFEKFSNNIQRSSLKYDTGKTPTKDRNDTPISKSSNKDYSLILDQMPISFKSNLSKKEKNLFSRMKNYFQIKTEKEIETKKEISKEKDKKEIVEAPKKNDQEESFSCKPNFSFGYTYNEMEQNNFCKNLSDNFEENNGKLSKYSKINEKDDIVFDDNYAFYESLFNNNNNGKVENELKKYSESDDNFFKEKISNENHISRFLPEKPRNNLFKRTKSFDANSPYKNDTFDLLNTKVKEELTNKNNLVSEIQLNNTKSKIDSFSNSISPNAIDYSYRKCDESKVEPLFQENYNFTPEEDCCLENSFSTPNKQAKNQNNTANTNGHRHINNSYNKKKNSMHIDKRLTIEINCEEANKRKDSRISQHNDLSSYFDLNKDLLPYRLSPKDKIDPSIDNNLKFFQNLTPKQNTPKNSIEFPNLTRHRINSNTLSNCGYNTDQTPLLRHDSNYIDEVNDINSLRRKKSVSKYSSKKNNNELKSRYDHITFDVSNYIEDIQVEETFDILVCFSLTKWIQLNWGDYGLLRQFKKLRSQVKQNGLLILEPHQWRSYKKKKNFSKCFEWNFKRIWLMPDQFPIHLKHFGFDLICVFENDYNGNFKRPLYVYKRFF